MSEDTRQPWIKAGVTHRQFDHWIRKGYFPGTRPGYGSSRVLTVDEVRRLTMMGLLVNNGMRPDAACAYIESGKAEAIIEAMMGDLGA